MSAAPMPLVATGPATPGVIPAARLAQIKKTAQQFEAIFVRQMLAAAHKSSFEDSETSSAGTGSQGENSFTDMQDARFADIASQKGAFGLAHMIEKQLMKREPASALPASSKAAAPTRGLPIAGTGMGSRR
jgi:flagellar protein FlgJ